MYAGKFEEAKFYRAVPIAVLASDSPPGVGGRALRPAGS